MPHLTLYEVAEIAATVTSLWEERRGQMERRWWEEAADRVGTNHPRARGYLTGDCSTFLRPQGPLGGLTASETVQQVA